MLPDRNSAPKPLKAIHLLEYSDYTVSVHEVFLHLPLVGMYTHGVVYELYDAGGST